MRRTIRLLAVLFLVGSIAYYLWNGFTAPDDDLVPPWAGPALVWPLVAMTVALFVFAFTGRSVVAALTGRNSAEFRDGPIGIGTVRSMSRTGMTLNDNPEVRIDLTVLTPDGRTFDSHAKQVVPLTELAALKPGAQVPVRYLPGRTDLVELDRSGDTAAIQAAMNQAMIRRGVTTQANIDIVERGVTAQAVVQELTVPGEIRDGNARLHITLAVTRPDGSVFSTEVVKFLPPPAVPHVQVGSVLTVHYPPGDEQRIVLSLPVNSLRAL